MRISDWSSDVCSSDLKELLKNILLENADEIPGYERINDSQRHHQRYRHAVGAALLVGGEGSFGPWRNQGCPDPLHAAELFDQIAKGHEFSTECGMPA